ncbi:MAG: SRPBCC family protein, partial [Pseudonocardiaceae bacterium]
MAASRRAHPGPRSGIRRIAMTSGTSTAVEEHVVVAAPAAEVFTAVADVRRMARWSPECFAVWIWRRQNGTPAR